MSSCFSPTGRSSLSVFPRSTGNSLGPGLFEGHFLSQSSGAEDHTGAFCSIPPVGVMQIILGVILGAARYSSISSVARRGRKEGHAERRSPAQQGDRREGPRSCWLQRRSTDRLAPSLRSALFRMTPSSYRRSGDFPFNFAQGRRHARSGGHRQFLQGTWSKDRRMLPCDAPATVLAAATRHVLSQAQLREGAR